MADARLVRALAPVAAIGLTLVVRKALASSYQAFTGNEPPKDDDPEASIARVLVFAVSTAVAVTIVNVLITRGVARHSARAADQALDA